MKAIVVLGRLFLISLALAAIPVATSAASEFEAEQYPAVVTGEGAGEHVFGLEDGLSLKCKGAEFEGELGVWSETEELSALYQECTLSGVSATVTMNGCVYKFYAGEELTEELLFGGTMDISCAAGKTIVVTSGTCELQIEGQSGLGTVEYENELAATPDTFDLTASIEKLKYNKAKDGFLCPFTGTGKREDGTYSGAVSLTGDYLEAQTGVKVGSRKTTLCKEEPKPACGSLVKEGSEIDGRAEEGKFTIKFSFREIPSGAIKLAINCGSSAIEMQTAADVGLPVKGVLLTFTSCETGAKKNACTVSMKEPSTGAIRWTGFLPHSGYMLVDLIELEFVCAKEPVNCRYKDIASPPPFYGGTEPKLVWSDRLSHISNKLDQNCYAWGNMDGEHKIVEPEKVWLMQK